MPKLYLIPNLIYPGTVDQALPPANVTAVKNLKYFMVENFKSARQFLKNCDIPTPFKGIELYQVNKHSSTAEKEEIMKPLLFKNEDMGFISDAGSPCIADPGSEVVNIAHQNGIEVRPLVGPNSILMALMGSGMNGQAFSFNGYLPIQSNDRTRKIKQLESDSRRTAYSQIFMETPFRNQSLFKELKKHLSKSTELCLACDLMSSTQEITTLRIEDWRKMKVNIDKRLCVFVLQAY